ncbi:MAG TPA: FAD:protein FMN transferase [Rudaea sp.]|nr:FAD:protein FMN transferase [Rudaea sp.]
MNSAQTRYPIHRFDFSAMGCPCALQLEADADVAARAAAAAQAEVDRLDRKYSHYRDDSLVGQIGASADAGESIVVDNETADLLDFSATLHAQSGGRFDITAGALTRLWDLQAARVPGATAIERARERCGWSRVDWQRPNLRLGVPGMRLDLGGVVKEYAADRAAQVCRDVGIVHGIVDLGGDLAVVGPHPDHSPWLAGIKAPRDTARAFARIELDRGGLATSGDYERAMIVDGRRYSHIVDPVSGYPVESFASVSVVADSCLVAGAASTLGMLLGLHAGYEWLENLGLPFLCIDAEGRASGTLAR